MKNYELENKKKLLMPVFLCFWVFCKEFEIRCKPLHSYAKTWRYRYNVLINMTFEGCRTSRNTYVNQYKSHMHTISKQPMRNRLMSNTGYGICHIEGTTYDSLSASLAGGRKRVMQLATAATALCCCTTQEPIKASFRQWFCDSSETRNGLVWGGMKGNCSVSVGSVGFSRVFQRLKVLLQFCW